MERTGFLRHFTEQSAWNFRDPPVVLRYPLCYTCPGKENTPMLDPVQIPILLKAIDFVFDEGRKILEERRERRRKMNDAPAQSEDQGPEAAPALPEPEREKEVKQGLLASKIDDLLWRNHEAEVQHLVRLLETYSRNYRLAKEQYAKWGDALVPPIIVNNMTEAEKSMLETLQRLEEVLSKVYERDIKSQ